MRTIYILHYHLNPGGVTRIIESQVRGLKHARPDSKIVVLTGHGGEMPSLANEDVDICIIDELNYLSPELNQAEQQQLLSALSDRLNDMIEQQDILHVHNLNLGKNPLLTLVVHELAQRGISVVNHCHDFAEDRPANMQFIHSLFDSFSSRTVEQVFYPELPNYAFVVLNSKDHGRIVKAGVEAHRLFQLPNPIARPGKLLPREEARNRVIQSLGLQKTKRIVTFPVRVIRRKNIGEFILLAHLFREQACWLVTQPPKNPVEVIPYREWKSFCSEMEIDIHFEAGEKVDFETLIIASDFCITTSVQEGFGMAFLEPWSYGTPVIGRDIGDVTKDLREFGIQLPRLYNSIDVVINGRKQDFARISPEEQRAFIRELVARPKLAKEIKRLNPFLNELLADMPAAIIEHNQKVIQQHFSIEEYGKRLFEIYDSIS